jgi:hypothetical protein
LSTTGEGRTAANPARLNPSNRVAFREALVNSSEARMSNSYLFGIAALFFLATSLNPAIALIDQPSL